MADKLTSKKNKKIKEFLKLFIKMNDLSKKSCTIIKNPDGLHKIEIRENIFNRDNKNLYYPPNWKYEQGRGFIYSSEYDLDSIEVKVEFKHLESINCAGDVLYELQLANPKMKFVVVENVIQMESNGADLNVDYLLAKGFERTDEGLVNKNVLHNGIPVQIALNKVSETSKEGNDVSKLAENAIDSKSAEALNSTAPDYNGNRVVGNGNPDMTTDGVEQTLHKTPDSMEHINNEKFNFDRMKYVFTRYALKVINNELVVVDKHDANKVLKDGKLIAETQMATVWYESCVFGDTQDNNVHKEDKAARASRIDLAFGTRGQDIYTAMLKVIERQVESGHGLDVEMLVSEMSNYQDREMARRIVSALLTNENPANDETFPIKSDKCLLRIKMLLAENLNKESMPEAKDLVNDNTPVMEMKKPENSDN